MKKKSRNSRSTETSWLQKTGDTNQKRRPNRGRPRKGQTAAADGPETDPTASTDPSVAADEAQKHAESVCRSTGEAEEPLWGGRFTLSAGCSREGTPFNNDRAS